MSKQISWRVVLVIKHGQINNFQALTEEMVESARQELGTLIYERFVTDDGNSLRSTSGTPIPPLR
jgi:quinol monooxygenase YgiN